MGQVELALQKARHRRILAQQPALDALVASCRQALEVTGHQGSHPLAGVTVLCTGFVDKATQHQVQQLVFSLGGITTHSHTSRLEADIVIAQSVLSPTYQVASASLLFHP